MDFYIDEFQDFCANTGSVKTFAQILSECRKFGLRLMLALQTLSQLYERMIGALGNIQTKIVFAVDRSDAEILALKLFAVNGEQIKHMVQDGTQQERTHPVFYTLQEEWEKCIQTIQSMPPRHALVKTQNRGAKVIRTIEVQDRKWGEEELQTLKRHLAGRIGLPYNLVQGRFVELELKNERKVNGGPVFWELLP